MTDNLNTGHGHVCPRPDGVKARCGGPAMCAVCQRERAALESASPAAAPKGAEVQPAEPALWPSLLLLVNAYAGHFADAAMQQSASRADISHAAALKALGEIRQAVEMQEKRWRELVHSLIFAATPAPAAPQAGDGAIYGAMSQATSPEWHAWFRAGLDAGKACAAAAPPAQSAAAGDDAEWLAVRTQAPARVALTDAQFDTAMRHELPGWAPDDQLAVYAHVVRHAIERAHGITEASTETGGAK